MPRPDLVLRPGRDGARLVPDVAYPRAFTLRVGRTDQSYVDLDDPRRLEFDYLEQIALVLDQLAPPGTPLRTVHVGQRVELRGRVLKKGRNVAFLESTATVDGAVVATGRVTKSIIARPDQPPE